MDDILELPNADVSKLQEPGQGEGFDDGNSSADEEEGGLDWTKLPLGPTASRPVIPKRGDKEYEPTSGSNLQKHYLERARDAMFDTLRAERTISNKTISYGVWYPNIARVHVTLARGGHFTSMGHSVPRPTSASGTNQHDAPPERVHKRLELLPEEALYLVERGAMFCWKEHDLFTTNAQQGLFPDDMEGVPMSVQQAYAEMIGKEDLTLERYQVYAYLKRLGYVVTRVKQPTPLYPLPPPYPSPFFAVQRKSLLQMVLYPIRFMITRITTLFAPAFNWWKPIRISPLLGINMGYRSIFRALRFIPHGHGIPLKANPKHPQAEESPYVHFFNLYKPSTPYKKTSPPVPDFAISVVSARTTSMPTLVELTALFDVLPEIPPPMPRARQKTPTSGGEKPQIKTAGNDLQSKTPNPGNVASASSTSTSWFPPWPFRQQTIRQAVKPNPERRPHPMAALKQGKKVAIIAVVDAGSPSFFRFGQGEFSEWPMAG
ncbi:tRNA-splicing endonuclease subunit sen54 N-term-domain-containing protein [Thelephora terrestris]|uniref:tRNA-splicing endonuclease subunit sen54 N-term-domain-containing protein n=1 Tax=Thelephora terrestris TaxID=56493 RepID=A0A9P6H2K4_9AGAM|nr:tRNA-splicing endonuclease subunit sen54 N-term-domain-containing protein [Thelephora terrestris]